MQSDNNNQRPTADELADEFASVRRSAIWGKPQGNVARDERQVVRVPLAQIDPDPNQPRRFFSQRSLEELKKSIQSRGQYTPAFVRPHPQVEGRYMLIAGERRYRVLKELGQETILVIVFRVSEQEAREIALIDNLQRADLSAFEEAAGYARLMEEFGYTQDEVAEKVGKDQTAISNTLRINSLPESIKKDDLAQQASKSVLLELARTENKAQQSKLWREIRKDIKAGIPVTVRKVREKRTLGQRALETTPQPVVDKAVLAGKQFIKQLEGLTPDELAIHPERQDALRGIKQRLDELFAGLAEKRLEPADLDEEVNA